MAYFSSEPDDVITLRLRSQLNGDIYFKFRRPTKMQKIFSAYATKMGVTEASLKFYLDGELLDGESTAESLGLDDNDVVDVQSSDSRTSEDKSGHHSNESNVKQSIIAELEENLTSSMNIQPQDATVCML